MRLRPLTWLVWIIVCAGLALTIAALFGAGPARSMDPRSDVYSQGECP